MKDTFSSAGWLRDKRCVPLVLYRDLTLPRGRHDTGLGHRRIYLGPSLSEMHRDKSIVACGHAGAAGGSPAAAGGSGVGG